MYSVPWLDITAVVLMGFIMVIVTVSLLPAEPTSADWLQRKQTAPYDWWETPPTMLKAWMHTTTERLETTTQNQLNSLLPNDKDTS